MKDKRQGERLKKVLHKGNEGQKARREIEKSPS